MGLLRIHVQKGVNLAIRDVLASDPYVVVKMGKQVKKKRNLLFLSYSSLISLASGFPWLFELFDA